MKIKEFYRLWFSIFFTIALGLGSLSACATPVFRYAMMNWEPDSHQATVFHDGPLGAEHQELLDSLKAGLAREQAPLNLKIELVDISKKGADEAILLLGDVSRNDLPAVVLSAPLKGKQMPSVFWHGALNSKTVKAVLNSPIRQQVVKQLIAGDVGVWVVVKSGHADKDNAMVQNLAKKLKGLQKELSEKDKLDAIPYLKGNHQFAFSIIPLSRENRKESLLLSMLLKMDSSVEYRSDEPIVFLFFGQGRVLAGYQGEKFSDEVIAETCTFLSGDCSCTVKAENPGYDMLLAAKWSDATKDDEPLKEEELRSPFTGVFEGSEPDVQAKTASAPVQKASVPFAQNIILAIGGMAGLAFLVSGLMFFRRRRAE